MDCVYSGEQLCSATLKGKDKGKCKGKAYYSHEVLGPVCGRHAGKEKTKLPENPNKQEILETLYKSLRNQADNAAQRNESGVVTIMTTKLRMMKAAVHKPGFLSVFPNYKHGDRKDGLGMPTLSPCFMRECNHEQPGLPNATCIENFHQGNKVFPSEVDESGNPTQKFYEERLRIYQSKEPIRHKPARTNKSVVPLYSIWVEADGTEIRNSYVESRKYYCGLLQKQYDESDEFTDLILKLSKGYSINILGYDARPDFSITSDDPAFAIAKAHEFYNDVNLPFGHEMVLTFYLLYCILEIDPRELPWAC